MWHPFGYKGEPGTCKWCGRKLRFKMLKDWIGYNDETGKRRPGGPWSKGVRAKLAGSYQDGHFCGLRCGYEFGLRMAQLGRRLEALKPNF